MWDCHYFSWKQCYLLYCISKKNLIPKIRNVIGCVEFQGLAFCFFLYMKIFRVCISFSFFSVDLGFVVFVGLFQFASFNQLQPTLIKNINFKPPQLTSINFNLLQSASTNFNSPPSKFYSHYFNQLQKIYQRQPTSTSTNFNLLQPTSTHISTWIHFNPHQLTSPFY